MASWKNNPVVGVVAGVVLVAAIVGIIFALQPKKEEMTLISKSTGEIVKMKVAPGTQFPIVNPKTGKKDLYLAIHYRCANGHDFYLPQTPDTPTQPKCPKDGTENVSIVTEK